MLGFKSSTFVLALAPIVFFATNALANGGFEFSCVNDGSSLTQESDGYYLTAPCGDGKGNYRYSSIRLGLCVGNSNGALVGQDK